MLPDILITLRKLRVLFDGLSPKGTEWILRYTSDAPVDFIKPEFAEKFAVAIKHEAEKQGLKVEIFR